MLTDSDRAGFLIRNFIKSCTAGETVYHAFIPELKGKEKRKTEPGKEGLLGVEGMEADVIIGALQRSGATLFGETKFDCKNEITKLDLYRAGFYGKENSKLKREEFLKQNGLPTKISANMLVESVKFTVSQRRFRIILRFPQYIELYQYIEVFFYEELLYYCCREIFKI